MRFGLMTGGGDAPGLNGILEAVSKNLLMGGHDVIGIQDGFEGVFEGNTRPVSFSDVDGLHAESGTFLGTSNRCGTEGREPEFLEKYKKLELDGLIVAGGDGTFSGLQKLKDDVNIIGVPKTIDNDLSGTEVTFGYDTACSVVSDAVDALRNSADAHRRCMVVETMGRTAGWIALGGGMASYADMIFIPERPYKTEEVLEFVRKKQKEKRGMVIVMAEGATPEGGEATVAFRVEGSPQEERLGGVSQLFANWLERETGWESRSVILGHLQRSEAPTPTDRFLTLAMGVQAAQLAQTEQWGTAVVFRKGRVRTAPITDLMEPPRLVHQDDRWVKMAQAVGIFV